MGALCRERCTLPRLDGGPPLARYGLPHKQCPIRERPSTVAGGRVRPGWMCSLLAPWSIVHAGIPG
eukprot:scaffold104_cov375-Prasinococcus_capsulatus_cf.AAC.19